ncbi:hypothetical protein OSC52_11990 [Clostridium pasteurianum]|uniref:hypothetical protein n=1 Tax=Clostridium pasteurianum TaxID=1501 RepID=UPI002260EEBC|nr:hypothetical protein [Clostridium pasteurianum]UZW12576.1 hypothetical protein OSC52_11990 [Clostridium pasteurianum]
MKNNRNISLTLEWIFYIIGIISSIFTIVGTIINNNSSNKMITIPFAIGVIIVIIGCIYKLSKQEITNVDKFHLISDVFHKTNHVLKDEINNISNNDSAALTMEMLDSKLKDIIEIEIEGLAEILTYTTKQKVSVCIKYFDDNIQNIFDGQLKTLIRSKSSHRDRPCDNQTIIKEITDYTEIILKNKNYFYRSDLKSVSQYINVINWDKFYNTRIVVPIRFIPESKIHTLGNKKYYGFICVDAKKSKTFENEKDTYINLICGVADKLYIYFRDYAYCCNQLLKEKEVAVNGDFCENIQIR